MVRPSPHFPDSFFFDVVNGVRTLYLHVNFLSCESFHEDLRQKDHVGVRVKQIKNFVMQGLVKTFIGMNNIAWSWKEFSHDR